MTRNELAAEVIALRPLVTNVIGFLYLAEMGDVDQTPLKRTIYDARVYANGVILAEEVQRIIDALRQSDP